MPKAKDTTIKDLKNIIVELLDKGSIYNDFIQRKTFTAGSLVQKIKVTPSIRKAIQEGVLKEVNDKRLAEWGEERKAYIAQHTKIKKESNEALAEEAITAPQKVKAAKAAEKTAKAEAKGANAALADKAKENEELKKELKKAKK